MPPRESSTSNSNYRQCTRRTDHLQIDHLDHLHPYLPSRYVVQGLHTVQIQSREHVLYVELLIDISLSRNVLGWYIPGLSELPLGNRLILLLAGRFQRIFVFFISLGGFGYVCLFYFASCAWVYSEHCTAGKPVAVAGVSGFWRVEKRLDGARSPFSCLGVACVSKHEGSMSGICLASICIIRLSMYDL